jgi:hypothetical protein
MTKMVKETAKVMVKESVVVVVEEGLISSDLAEL